MNKFINTATGGLPFKHDDIRWNDDAYRNAFFGLLKAFNVGANVNFIVSGCVATITPGVNCVVTAGYIFLNGELLQVEAQTVAYSGSNVYKYTKASTFDTTGDRVLKNTGATVQTYQKNRGVVSSGAASGTELSVEGDRLETKIFATDSADNFYEGKKATDAELLGGAGNFAFVSSAQLGALISQGGVIFPGYVSSTTQVSRLQKLGLSIRHTMLLGFTMSSQQNFVELVANFASADYNGYVVGTMCSVPTQLIRGGNTFYLNLIARIHAKTTDTVTIRLYMPSYYDTGTLTADVFASGDAIVVNYSYNNLY